jgi:hypothetical protein
MSFISAADAIRETAEFLAKRMYNDRHSKTIYDFATTRVIASKKFDTLSMNHLIYWRFKLEERAHQFCYWKNSDVGTCAVKIWAQRMLLDIHEASTKYPTVEDVINVGLGRLNKKVTLLTDYTKVF